MKHACRFTLVALSLLCVTSAVTGETDDPRVLVEHTIETLREHVERDPERIKTDLPFTMDLIDRLVSPHIDMRLASKLALGVHWREAQPAQRDGFIDAMRGLLLRIFAVHIDDYRDARVTYLPTIFKGEKNQLALVRTSVSREGIPPVRVDYRMYSSPDGWKVFDVRVIGISIVKTYRVTIEYDLRKRGLDAIIDQINAQSPLPKDIESSATTSPTG